MSVMSGCLGRRCFNADGGRRCRCFVVSSCSCVMRRLRLRAFLLRLFFLWLVFFLLFFAFVGPGMVQGQSWGYVTGWDRVQVRRQKMSRRCQRLSRIVFVSSDTRAPPIPSQHWLLQLLLPLRLPRCLPLPFPQPRAQSMQHAPRITLLKLTIPFLLRRSPHHPASCIPQIHSPAHSLA
jgi:hypothetical protein